MDKIMNDVKKMMSQGNQWLSSASTSTLLIIGGVLLLSLVTGLGEVVMTIALFGALVIVAYYAVLSWKKSKDTSVNTVSDNTASSPLVDSHVIR